MFIILSIFFLYPTNGREFKIECDKKLRPIEVPACKIQLMHNTTLFTSLTTYNMTPPSVTIGSITLRNTPPDGVANLLM